MTFAASDILADTHSPASASRMPARRAESIRRTISLDVRFQDGRGSDVLVDARGRDLLTSKTTEEPVELATDRLQVRISADRVIQALAAQPTVEGLDALIGRSSLRGLRAATRTMVDPDQIAGRPMRVLLDDLVGISVIADAVWQYWPSAGHPPGPPPHDQHPPVGTCIGFRPGSSALQARYAVDEAVFVPALDLEGDPFAFHPVLSDSEPGLRRIRRLDVWATDNICIDAMFQDSVLMPDGQRAGVHEYALTATADPETLGLTAIEATPGLLPHRECFEGRFSLEALVGLPLADLREAVLVQLRGVAGCTHLNDAARALCEAAQLVNMLRATPGPTNGEACALADPN